MQFGSVGNNANSTGSVVNLSKGQKISLTKVAPAMKKILVGLGWDTNKYTGGKDFDLDASAFLCDEKGKSNPNYFIFYSNPEGPNGCIKHMGDNRVGGSNGDDEQIYIDLDKVPSQAHRIAITVTIYQADKNGQCFGQVSNAYIRLVNDDTGEEVIRYDLGEDFSSETALVVAEFYRHNGEWKFDPVGAGFSGGLVALCANYGIDAEE